MFDWRGAGSSIDFPNTCFAVGGYVYRGNAVPCLRGTYVFGDGCGGVASIYRASNGTLSDFTVRTPAEITVSPATSFGEDASGELYVASIWSHAVYKLEFVSYTGADCDANSISDGCDIRMGLSTDTNTNSVPDRCEGLCTDIDFNNDGLYPDNNDIADLFTVFGGGACPAQGVPCDSIDFNGDGLFPDNLDLTHFLSVFGGGGCE